MLHQAVRATAARSWALRAGSDRNSWDKACRTDQLDEWLLAQQKK